MSACSCCPQEASKLPEQNTLARYRQIRLFNWVTVLLLSGWVGIVAVASHLTGTPPAETSAAPALEAFLRLLF